MGISAHMTLGTSQGTVVFAPVALDGLELANKVGTQHENLTPI